MSHTVFCRKYQQPMEGLARPPFPGPQGQAIFDTVSRRAWEEWQIHQTRLLNEKHINAFDPQARAYLAEQREKFLANAPFDVAEGYVPPPSDTPDPA